MDSEEAQGASDLDDVISESTGVVLPTEPPPTVIRATFRQATMLPKQSLVLLLS